MAEPANSILLVDFDSLHRSLTAGGGEAAARFSMKVAAWAGGLENGRLLGPEPRRFALKRCYADPKAIGDSRANFIAAGFDVIDCAATAHGRGVDVLMAMDAVERVAEGAHLDELVLLSAEQTLGALLTRVRSRGRRSAIYADTHTAQTYRAQADAVLDITAFAEFLLTQDVPEGVSGLAVERSEIEAFARRVHAATNIPLFSPRTFAELFRLLTEEIVANGYHFQSTAKNVSEKLSETGRSVTRRQVVFIVKGLALKGHVFSTSDTPRKLAEVFREQARYLIENAGLKLDEAQERVLSAWLVDRAPISIARAAPSAPRQPAPAPAAPALAPTVQMNGSGAAAADIAPPAPTTAPIAAKSEPMMRPSLGQPAAEKLPERLPEPVQAQRDMPFGTTPIPPRSEPRVTSPMISPEDARAAIAAKIAQSVRPKTAARALKPALATSLPPPPAPGGNGSETGSEPQSIENSILAAIAEAVDVLVEDGESTRPKKMAPPSLPVLAKKRPTIAVGATAARLDSDDAHPMGETRAVARPRTPVANGEGGDDIGDEIQRIIATYSRNRNRSRTDLVSGQGKTPEIDREAVWFQGKEAHLK